LWSRELRTLLPNIEVLADPEFTEAYDRVPVEHRTRVTVVLRNGEHVGGYAGGEAGDLSQNRSDAEIEEKFRTLTHDALTRQGTDAALAMLWRLDAMPDAGAIPELFRFA
jgi:2-methylcitrate dehydratase PrpD